MNLVVKTVKLKIFFLIYFFDYVLRMYRVTMTELYFMTGVGNSLISAGLIRDKLGIRGPVNLLLG
jgi:hypothetical protein